MPSEVFAPAAAPPGRVAARLPFYYGWVNLTVAALAMTATLPGRTHGLGLITKPLQHDLVLTGTVYGAFNFWSVLLGAAFCLPVGRLLDRFGCRLVLTGVALALGAVVLAMSRVTEPAELFVLLTLTRGLGQGALSVVSLALVGKWFRRRLGLAMGVYSVLLALGFIAATLGVGGAVQTFGWRDAWAGVGLALLFGLAPLGWLLTRSTPEGCGLDVETEPARPDPVPTDADFTLGQALRSRVFWAFGLGASLFGMVWSAITLFNQSILEEHRFDANTFLLVMTVLTGSGLVSNLAGGWAAGRVALGRLLAAGMVVLAGTLLAFPSIESETAVVLYALALGVSGGVITVVFFAVWGQAFGRAHLGKIQGAAQVLSVFASALGPWLLEVCKEATGSYSLFFFGSAPAAALLGLWAWRVPVRRAEPPCERNDPT
jgi:MFS family permease